VKYLSRVDKSVLLLILFLVSFLVYLPALNAPFFWDDYISIPEIQPYRGIEHTESRPLRIFSFFLDSYLWRGNSAGYHFTNLLLNSLAIILAFFFVNFFLKHELKSFFVTLLFALHPIHTETVIWVKNRTEILFFIFFALSFLTYRKNFLLSFFSFILCALAKETSVIFPLLLTLHIHFFEKKKKHLPTLPFYLIAFLRAVYSIGRAGEIVGRGVLPDFSSHIALIINTFAFYLEKLVFPLRLLVDWSPDMSFSVLSILICFVFAALIFFRKADLKTRFFFILLFLAILPYSNIIFIAGRPLGEQRMYFPSLVFIILAFTLVDSILRKEVFKYSLLFVVLLSYGGRTYLRALEWKNPVLLWKQAEKYYPDSPRIKHNLGGIFYEKGDYERAKMYYLRALGKSADESGYYLSLHNLALIYMKENDFENAEKTFEAVLKKGPGNPAVLYNAGLLFLKEKKYEKAVHYFERVRKLLPENMQVYNNLAVAYMFSGKSEKAASVLEEAIGIAPEYEKGRYNLIVIYKKSGKRKAALTETEKALEVFPNHPVFLKLYQELKS